MTVFSHMYVCKIPFFWHTVDVEIFAQFIFSRISRSVLCARKYDVSEKMNHYSADRSNLLDARKFVHANIPAKAGCAKI